MKTRAVVGPAHIACSATALRSRSGLAESGARDGDVDFTTRDSYTLFSIV
jgi:hypothetical protein